MKREPIIWIIVVVLVAIGSFFIGSSFKGGGLPDDFTMEITMDGTSSGATRIYSATIMFEDGSIASGGARGYIDTSMGIQKECIDEYDPITSSWINKIMREKGPTGDWSDVTESTSCYELHNGFLTEKDILNAMSNGEIVEEPCGRGAYCYEIK